MDDDMLALILQQLDNLTNLLLQGKNTNTSGNASGKIGRPTKGHIVLAYRQNHPHARKSQCCRETGLSIKTVSKYWEEQGENHE